jgi:hypothetical protein
VVVVLLKPEFGYLGQALAFTIFGLVACTSGAVLLVATAETSAVAPATAETPAVASVLAQKVTKADGIKSCQRNASDDVDANCAGVARDAGVIHPVTDLPATAEILIGHNNEAAVAPESAVLVASTPPLKEDTPESTDAAPPSSKSRKTAHHQSSHRYSYAGSSFWLFDHHYRRGDYARQRPWHFW